MVICPELSSLSYTSFDDMMLGVLDQGRGAKMEKADRKQAFRSI